MAGPSVGGLITLTFATRFPDRIRNVITIAAGYKTTVLNRLILFEQILAIENDPYFNGGDYYDNEPPLYGLALARMWMSFPNPCRPGLRFLCHCGRVPPACFSRLSR